MTTITQLLEKWEARSRDALPSDAMLINKHIRELREAVALQEQEPPPIDYKQLVRDCYATTQHAQGTPGCKAFARGAEWYREQVGELLAAHPRASATSVNCDECVHGIKGLDQHPCDACIHGRDFLSKFEPRFRAPKGAKS